MWNEPILHVDMDAFFVEVERLRDPSLIGKPVVVGGGGGRGVVASASYEARAQGVHSAQPTAAARRLCPDLIVVAPDHNRYREVSAEVFEVFRSYTPLVEGLSLDEAFLDASGLTKHHDSALAVAVSIKRDISEDLTLPCSVGIAANKFVAKLASAAAKPDGIRHVTREDQDGFLRALPVAELWGVGTATRSALDRFGVETVGDLADLPLATLCKAVGSTVGKGLHDLARGIDPRAVVPDGAAKSISVEETYGEDLESHDAIETALLGLAERLTWRLRRAGVAASTVSLKIRYHDFTTRTKAVTPASPLDIADDIFAVARELVALVDTSTPVRLLGMAGSGLVGVDSPRQLGTGRKAGWDELATAVDRVGARFGSGKVTRARLLGQPPRRNGDAPRS